MADIEGVMFNVVFQWDGSGSPLLTSAGASPIVGSDGASSRPSEGSSPEADVLVDTLTVGGAAVTALGIGAISRAARGLRVFSPGDLALDALTGAEIGSCLVGTPQAEAICLGAIGSLPLQILNRAVDRTWDYRTGMLSGALLSLARSELGTNPMLYDGYRMEGGRARLVTSELVANGFADTAWESGFFALSNTLAALLNGHTSDLGTFAAVGAGYGAALAAVVNLSIGAPLRLSTDWNNETVAHASDAGFDVSDVARRTTWRAGGIYQAVEGRASTTLGSTVHIAEMHINSETGAHELTHRDQIAGSPGGGGRGGAGFLSFYAQYFAWAPGGYLQNPYEAEAFHVGDGSLALPPRTANYGDAIASPFALGLFSLPLLLMPPPPR
ncbi:MAG: hypothetical protein IT381_30085 [Deltaproteobacteria bacterium]|nr:hypothetical protein [Deltaproteobacteria bacterium]